MDTKERILDEALTLFACRGYGAVSVRDIARSVGMKESSLYYHFKNKQEIFDTLVRTCFEKAQAYFRACALPFSQEDDISMYYDVGEEALSQMLLTTFRYFFEDGYNVRFRRLLNVSRYAYPQAAEIYRALYRDYPMKIQQRIFEALIRRGEMEAESAQTAALAFYGPIFMLMETCDGFEQALPLLKEHIDAFTRRYRKGRKA